MLETTRDCEPSAAGTSAQAPRSEFERSGELVDGIIHDFNNHLTAITGYSDFLQQDLPREDPRRADAAEIKQLALRAADVTRQFAIFLQERSAEPRVFCVDDVVMSLQKLLLRVVREDVALRLDLRSANALVRADPGQLNRVVLEAALDARRAMPDGGELVIQTRVVVIDGRDDIARDVTPGEYIALSICHSGERTSSVLSGADDVVRRNRGYLMVGPRNGVSASARVLLPSVDVAPAAQPATSPRGGETILLVEDEQALRVVAKRALDRQGYAVMEASNGAEAIGIASGFENPIDLLLTDIVMPVMGGYPLARVLTAERPQMRVLFVSGYAPDIIGPPTLENGKSAYLEKPFSTGQLTVAVRDLLDAVLPVRA